MQLHTVLEQLIRHEDLKPGQMQDILESCLKGELTDAQIAGFLALLRMKGETIVELTEAAKVLHRHAKPLALGTDLVDNVGTGGDGKHTMNVSTISSFVAAAAGARVAKHGNFSVSSRSGSADFLHHAGFQLSLSEAALKHTLDEFGLAFIFAPNYHQALQIVRPARQQLGIRTFFNLLGPLLNPAHTTKQVIGVYAKAWLRPVAHVLVNLGSEHALVVHSQDHLDEISIAAPTDVVEYRDGELLEWTIDPKDHGCWHPDLTGIVVASPEESLRLAKQVFAGEKGPARDIVLLNTAAVLYCSNVCMTYGEGIARAAEAIDSGEAGARFDAIQRYTNHEH